MTHTHTAPDLKTQIARIEKQRIRLGTFWHFYRVVLSSLPDDFTPVAGINTAATDGRKIFWNLTYIASLTDDELMFVLAHESLHCILLHHLRGRGLDQRLLNIAGDYVINLLLTIEGIGTMPQGCLLDTKFKDWSTEEVYYYLLEEQQAQQQEQPQQPQEQGEAGDDQEDGEGAQQGAGGSEDGDDAEGQSGSQAGEDGAEGNESGDGASAAGTEPEGSEGQATGNQGSQAPAGDEAPNGAGGTPNGAGSDAGEELTRACAAASSKPQTTSTRLPRPRRIGSASLAQQ